LEQPNFAPRALIGAFSGATGRIGLVLTGPNKRHATKRIWSTTSLVVKSPKYLLLWIRSKGLNPAYRFAWPQQLFAFIRVH
ncbi:MAG: hypothetical protein JAZ19_09295, partial [Candidatus Thiodiazotropha taylori]|nr:hypothetical protein [Candidatus Thiodiazotropha taylori]